MGEQAKEHLIEVRDVKVYFYLDEGTVRAVEGVTFDIEQGAKGPAAVNVTVV